MRRARLYAAGSLWCLLACSTAEGAATQALPLDVPERAMRLRDYKASAAIGLAEPGGQGALCVRASMAAKDVELRIRGMRGIAYHRGIGSLSRDERTSEVPWTDSTPFCR
jgi:hypothetical protein